MKYRRLTKAELEELQPQFIRFLATNKVTGMDWQTMKTAKPERAEELIELFSDIVFEGTLEKVEYLEFKTPHDMKLFHCLKEEIKMIGLMFDLDSPPPKDMDFTKAETTDNMMEKLKTSGAKMQLYSAEKKYKGSREQELFRMMESGCLISKDGALYKTLAALAK